ncbi:helix-turn-helix transcriptional regulator [Nocardioides cynanchi]|uniref:helix-turn-helix transcriptional regulator n=1 Tax=Nocardioides cynanchi TaxID=2558918 RepID=UPI00124561BA|nr:WYL domain-containing protein [Nocardioides cynanchi]
MHDTSPTARALLCLEMIQNSPGVTALVLAERLGLSDRAVRRYVAILREAEIPIESERGRYGGYRVGRGLRLPPLMFTSAEALGLVMAAVEGRGASDTTEPVGSALAKIIRVLPERVAGPARAVGQVASPGRRPEETAPDPELTAELVEARESGHRVRLDYRTASGRTIVVDLDPWAVVVRHGLWYLLCWSYTADARRALRIDRALDVQRLPDRFTPPPDLDPVRMLEEQLSQGWTHEIEVIVEAPLERVSWWIPRSIGRLEETDGGTRLLASTDDLAWYAEMLSFVHAPFHVVRPQGLRDELAALAARLDEASRPPAG